MFACPACSAPCEPSHKFCPACGFPLDKVNATVSDPLIGRALPGGFVIQELIGIGGMGRVYRGEQRALGRTVAIKVVHGHLAGDDSASSRFITEARTASRLNHPNSVGIIDFGRTDDGQSYLVMEYLRGRDLARVIYEDGLPPFQRIIDVLKQVLAALGDAHALGIIHRDVKPENIVLEPTRGGRDLVKVVDFGLAKMLAEPADRSLTLPGIVCGTPDYMAPEQGRGDPIDGRTDIYAVGVILYLLLTGKLPFEDTSPTQVVLKHMTVPPVDPRVAAPERNIPDAIAEVCLKALAKQRDDRYENADAFAAALSDSLGSREPAGRLSLEVFPCPACGVSNPRGQKFCGECGVRLPAAPTPNDSRPRTPVATQTGSLMTPAVATLPLPLLGRDEDVAWLVARRGEMGGSMLGARLVGEDGVGKSRLVREFLASTGSSGDVVVEVGPDPWWAGVGWWALRKLIISLAKLPPTGGGHTDWMGAGIEARRGLTELFGTNTQSDALEPESRRYLVAEALRWALVRSTQLAGGRGVVVVVDDLQRVDGASRNALSDVLLEPPLAPVLLIATHPHGFDAGWGSLAPARVLEGIDLALVTPYVGDIESPPSSLTRHGVLPMYIEQLVHAQRERVGDMASGTSLADILSARLQRLGLDARMALQALSVLGDGAQYLALDELLKRGAVLDGCIDELMSAAMIDVSEAGLRFEHPILREVVHATIPAAVRREMHETALHAAQDTGQPLEVQALHAFAAEDSFESLLLLEQVASRASARGDASGSVFALSRGLDLARREFVRGELDDPPRAVFIFSCKLGEALVEMGNFTDADGVLREALDQVGPSGEDRARILRVLAKVARGRGRNGDALDLLREAVIAARKTTSDEMVASLEAMIREFSAP